MMKQLTKAELTEALHEQVPIFDANTLTGPKGLGHIKLGDQLYTLRITRAGKLILTK